MGKFVKLDDILFEKKLSKPEDFDVGAWSKKVAEDLGAMVKVTALQDFKDIITNKAGKGKKWDSASVTMGTKAGKLYITGKAKNKEEEGLVVVKDYAARKAKKPTVIDLDHGDKTIKTSSERMAKAKGVDVTLPEDKDLSKVKGDVIILAHGAKSGGSPGKIYCKAFANKNVKDIVKFLAKDKPLPLSYSDTVYLDGCFTAAGPSNGKSQKDLNNFAGQVYNGLVKAGYKYLQVKGNLRTAVTHSDGSEGVKDVQAEEALKKVLKDANSTLSKIDKNYKERQKVQKARLKDVNDLKKKRMEVQKKLKTSSGDVADKLNKALELLEQKIEMAMSAMKQQVLIVNQLYELKQKEVKKLEKAGVHDKEIKDLVGTFGPEKMLDTV